MNSYDSEALVPPIFEVASDFGVMSYQGREFPSIFHQEPRRP